MATLFGRDFQDRAWLQHRQAYHQALTESQRFDTQSEGVNYGRRSGGQGGAGFLATAGGFLAVVFFFFTIPAAILAALIAVPAALGLWFALRVLLPDWRNSLGGLYRTVLIGIFSYLAVAAVIGCAIAIQYGFNVSLWPLVWAFAGLHVAGLLACAGVLSRRIGGPLYGLKGFGVTLLLSSGIVPASLTAVLMGLGTLLA